MWHTLARIVADDNICRVQISFRRKYLLWGDNMFREYRHILSPSTISEGATIYVARHLHVPQRINVDMEVLKAFKQS